MGSGQQTVGRSVQCLPEWCSLHERAVAEGRDWELPWMTAASPQVLRLDGSSAHQQPWPWGWVAPGSRVWALCHVPTAERSVLVMLVLLMVMVALLCCGGQASALPAHALASVSVHHMRCGAVR